MFVTVVTFVVMATLWEVLRCRSGDKVVVVVVFLKYDILIKKNKVEVSWLH